MGLPAQPGWVVASTMTGYLRSGSPMPMPVITKGPLPGMLKITLSNSGVASAALIASSRLQCVELHVPSLLKFAVLTVYVRTGETSRRNVLLVLQGPSPTALLVRTCHVYC